MVFVSRDILSKVCVLRSGFIRHMAYLAFFDIGFYNLPTCVLYVHDLFNVSNERLLLGFISLACALFLTSPEIYNLQTCKNRALCTGTYIQFIDT